MVSWQFDSTASRGRYPGLEDSELRALHDNRLSYIRGNLGLEDVYPGATKRAGIFRDPLTMRPSWRRVDQTMCRLARHGLTWTPILTTRIPWTAAPNSRKERLYFRNFAYRVAERFRPGGRFWARRGTICPAVGVSRPVPEIAPTVWEVWNEPNARVFWNFDPDPEQYRLLLRHTRRGLREADPGARVMFGGLANAPPASRRDPARFYLEVIQGGQQPFTPDCLGDAVAFHPYGDSAARSEEAVVRMREAMNTGGAHDVPLWLNEWGWAIRPPGRAPAYGKLAPPAGSEADQATQVSRFLERMGSRRAELNIGVMQYFALRDRTAGEHWRKGAKHYDYMGLAPLALGFGGTLRVRSAFAELAAAAGRSGEPAAPPPLRCPGVH